MSPRFLPSPLPLALAVLLSGPVPTSATPPEPTQLADLNRQIVSTETLIQSAQLEDRLLFVTLGPQNDSRLWASDLTAGGTEHLLAECDALCFDSARIVATGGRRVFLHAIETATHVPQLLATDGTPTGTRQLTHLTSTDGLLSGSGAYWSDGLGRLFFAASEGLSGRELWSTDGTAEGTGLLLDLFPGEHSSSPNFVDVAETSSAVFFTAINEDGLEVWRTDGTPGGTFQVRDVAPGPRFSFANHLTSVGERVVFSADDGVHGLELWTTDGSPAGTRLLLDATPGSGSSLVGSRQVTTGQAFFMLADGERFSMRHLVATDGTVAGTRVVATFERAEVGNQPEPELVAVLGSTVVLRVAGVLWVSDGTSPGTRPIGCVSNACPSSPHDFRSFGDHVVFRATRPELGLELWTTDGTEDGTHLRADLCPGSCSGDPRVVASADEGLYVRADDGIHGEELWLLTSAHELRLSDFADLHPFLTTFFAEARVGSLHGEVQFLAEDPEHELALWSSDGTPSGTRAIRTVGDIFGVGSDPHGFTHVGPHLLFAAHTELGLGLWRLGLPGSLVERVATLDPEFMGSTAPRVRATTTSGPRMFFADERQTDGDVWVTDGSPAGTHKLANGLAFGPGTRRDLDKVLPALGASVFFHTVGDHPGLWITEGTLPGTRRLREMVVDGEEPARIFRNRLWFRGLLDNECRCELELWVSDGTPAGTRTFADLDGDDSSSPALLTPFRGELYFVTTSGLWKTDGTTPPVEALRDVPLGRIDAMTVLGNRLLMSIDSNGSDASLWATDGTAAGTLRIAPASPRQVFHLEHPQQAMLAGLLFFLDSRGGLWRTDGTPGGTFPVHLLPLDGRQIVGIHTLPGRLLVVTREETGTQRLWLSAGSADRTEPLPRLEAAGRDFATFASRVFFSGNDGRTGLEPWTFLLPATGEPPPPPPTGPLAAPSHLQAAGHRFGEVRLTWQDRSSNESSFVIQVRGSRLFSEFETVATLPAGTTSFTIVNLEPDRPHHFRVRAENADGVSDWSPEAVAAPVDVTGDCTLEFDLGRVLCLQDGRFEVRVHWRHELGPSANDGDGHPTRFAFSDDSGTFWFFDQANIELVVKVLDARPVNGFQWVFYGALSDVEYWITVTDTQTETNVTYYNRAGEICGRGDVRAFPRPETPGSSLSASHFSTDRALRRNVPRVDAGSAQPCTPGAAILCLSQNRYRVEVEWKDHRSGDEGHGFAIPGTADSGFFWFFDSANVELVVKVLDARTVNGHVWIFFGALTDVEYTVTVTDTAGGLAKTYHNEAGNICGQADVRAF